MNAGRSLSRTAIDQLGERLRASVTVADLRLLDQYRRTFREDYDHVIEALRAIGELEISGRPAKSTLAIVDKLNRGSIRLSQMQDIAGCRIIVVNTTAQDDLATKAKELFPSTVFDRRSKSSHGYRAVHVVVQPGSLPIEIQIRTKLQHLWAELSEKLADVYGAEVKYGKGEPDARRRLDAMSMLIANCEHLESEFPQRPEVTAWKQDIQDVLSDFLRSADDFSD